MAAGTGAMILTAERVLMPVGRAQAGWVELEAGTIVRVGTGAFPGTPDVDLGAGLLAPGFVDMHSHGGGGASFEDGADAARVVLGQHLAAGTTSMIASLVSADIPQLRSQIAALAPLVEAGDLVGVHLEGPWLSPAHRGAHDNRALSHPTPAQVDAAVPAAQRTVRMVTLAPELPGALTAVATLHERGVLAAIGHTDADAHLALAAVDAGATVATHLFNAMPPLHHRQLGPAGVCLDSPRVTVELVADTIHVAPEVLALAARAARGGFVLVTDAMAAAGMGDGRYRLGNLEVDVVDGVARLVDGGAIAGSTLTLDRAVATLAGAGVLLEDAVRAATQVPARLLGLPDRGVLVAGARADLVHLTPDTVVDAVFTGGVCHRPAALTSTTTAPPPYAPTGR